jgi:arylsulfatase
MVDNIDQNVGRLRAALEEMGEWDNTVFLFTSDNGGSREGEAQGTSAYLRMLNTMVPDSLEADLTKIDEMGGPNTFPHYPRGWAQASNTPFRLYKINTHAGGHSVPFIVSWPDGLTDPGGLRRQYTYVTDVVPTLLDLAGVPAATHRNGKPVKPIAGTTFEPTLSAADAPSQHTEQVVEMIGHRGFYRDGWEAVTLHQPNTAFSDDTWELFDLTRDPTQVHDLADAEPEKLQELLAAWEEAAWANQVFPLDEGLGLKYMLRPEAEAGLEDPVTIFRGTPQLERYRSYKLIQMRSFTAALDLVDEDGNGLADGTEGVLLAHGDQGGGYAVYLEGDELVYAHNAYGTMHDLRVPRPSAGTRELVLDVEAPGRWRWTVRLLADGAALGSLDELEMIAFMAPFEGIDVGLDRASPVDWALHERRGTFPFSGTVRSATYTPGEPAPDAGIRYLDLLREMGARFE